MTKFLSRPLQNGPTVAPAITAVLTGAAALCAAFYGVSPAAAAGDYDVGSIHISEPWSRATPRVRHQGRDI